MATSTPITVALVGSTGNVGSYILHELLRQSISFRRILCLNRSADAPSRQKAQLRERDLDSDAVSNSRVTFYQIDSARPDLGLSASDYDNISSTVDVLIYNAWPVNFNHPFHTFAASIEAWANVLYACASSDRGQRCRFVFISSVAAVSNWAAAAPTSTSRIVEAEVADWQVAKTGYGQSKLVAERLLCKSAREWGLVGSVLRVGQLAGPVEHGHTHGHWPTSEWVPSLIRSSLHLGVLPDTLGTLSGVDWIPVDLAARAIAELTMATVHRQKHGQTQFYHVVNPGQRQWAEFTPTILDSPGSKTVGLTGFVDWVDLVKQSARIDDGLDKGDVDENPAIRLLDYFSMIRNTLARYPRATATPLDTRQAVRSSPTLAQMRPVSGEWMALWLKQWQYHRDGNETKEQSVHAAPGATSHIERI